MLSNQQFFNYSIFRFFIRTLVFDFSLICFVFFFLLRFLTVGGPPRVCDADLVVAVVPGVGMQEFHAVGGVPPGGVLGHHQFPVEVDRRHTRGVVASVPQNGQALFAF